jgi:hypothetical protein
MRRSEFLPDLIFGRAQVVMDEAQVTRRQHIRESRCFCLRPA